MTARYHCYTFPTIWFLIGRIIWSKNVKLAITKKSMHISILVSCALDAINICFFELFRLFWLTYCLRWPNGTFNESETSWWMDQRTKKIKPGRPLQSSNNASARWNNVLWKHEKAPQLTTSEHLRAKHTSSKIMRGRAIRLQMAFFAFA